MYPLLGLRNAVRGHRHPITPPKRILCKQSRNENNQTALVENLTNVLRKLRPRPTTNHSPQRIFVHPALTTSTHVKSLMKSSKRLMWRNLMIWKSCTIKKRNRTVVTLVWPHRKYMSVSTALNSHCKQKLVHCQQLNTECLIHKISPTYNKKCNIFQIWQETCALSTVKYILMFTECLFHKTSANYNKKMQLYAK